jgi:hypothetical protein
MIEMVSPMYACVTRCCACRFGTFGPIVRRSLAVRSYREVVEVDVEFALAGSVWDWTRQQCPGDRQVADRAVRLALHSYASGASVAEACEQVRAFVSSWVHHPSHLETGQGGHLRVAS